MRLALLGDLHIRKTPPQCRTDNYFETVMRKFSFILSWCKNNNIDAIIQPGDFFDSHRASHELTAQIIYAIRSYLYKNIPIIGVYGQHDLRFHSLDTSNTPLNVLENAGVFNRVTPKTFFQLSKENEPDVFIYGSSWGEGLPSKEENTPFESFRVLVTHRMVIDDKKVWEGQKTYDLASRLLRENNFDLIVSGDNHKLFVAKHKHKLLVNGGSMLRTSVSQKDHHPKIHVFDTITKKLTRISIPTRPFYDIATIEEHIESKVHSDKIVKFIEGISKTTKTTLDFRENVFNSLEGVDENTIKEINSIFRSIDQTFNMTLEDLKYKYGSSIKKEKFDGDGKSSETAATLERFYKGRSKRQRSISGGIEHPDEYS